jgi:hypothetical protein
LPFKEESLSNIAQLSIAQRAAFGERAGQKLGPYGIKLNEAAPEITIPQRQTIQVTA